jgi:hypothetical protein
MGAVHWLDALTPPLEKHLKSLAESVKTLLSLSEEPIEASEKNGSAPATVFHPGPTAAETLPEDVRSAPKQPRTFVQPTEVLQQENMEGRTDLEEGQRGNRTKSTPQSSIAVPRSFAALAPHIIGAFLVVNGAFLAVFAGTLFIEGMREFHYGSGRDQVLLVASLLALIPAALMFVSGVGTIIERKWASVLKFIVCVLGVLITPIFAAFTLYDAIVRRVWASEHVLGYSVMAYSVILAFCFISILYGQGWKSAADRLRGSNGNVWFIVFLTAVCALTVITLLGIGQYEYSSVYEHLWSWVTTLVVADVLISTYCFARFRRRFGVTAAPDVLMEA